MIKQIVFSALVLLAAISFAKDSCIAILTGPVEFGSLKSSFVHTNKYSVEVNNQGEVKDQCSLGTCHLQAWASILDHDFKVASKNDLKISTEYLSAKHWLETSLRALEFSKDDEPFDVKLGANPIFSKYAIMRFGIVPEFVWKPKSDFTKPPLSTKIAEYVKNIILRNKWQRSQESDQSKRKEILAEGKKQIALVFENAIGKFPEKFNIGTQEFTPQILLKGVFPNLVKPVVLLAAKERVQDANIQEAVGIGDQFRTAAIEDIERVAKELLDQGKSVYLSYDHQSAYVDMNTGIMSVDAFHMPWNAGPVSREQRNYYSLNKSGHAVHIVGYDADPATGQILKWKIKNSWGTAKGDEGYYHMYSDFFRSFAMSITFFAEDAAVLPEVQIRVPEQIKFKF